MIARFISVIIPNYNGAKTIGKCLDALHRFPSDNIEIIVVDDCSTDNSVEVISGFPCTLIRLDRHSGASRARNEGAKKATGDALFFIDSDCVITENTLEIAHNSYLKDCVIGGTYTPLPFDKGFFNTFQSVFINYSETKADEPDYIATHAMLINRAVFLENEGFKEDFMPILEDVEFSHRLNKNGIKLIMEPDLKVRHIFGFSLFKSLKNAFKKSKYWTAYSLKNKDLLGDSGTASIELKFNSLTWAIFITTLIGYFITGKTVFFGAFLPVFLLNLIINRGFIKALFNASGPIFAASAFLYYQLLYPMPVILGGIFGLFLSKKGQL